MTLQATPHSCNIKTPCPLCSQPEMKHVTATIERKDPALFAYLRDAPLTTQTERDDSSEILSRLERESLDELFQKLVPLKRKEYEAIQTMNRTNNSRTIILSQFKEPDNQSEINILISELETLKTQLEISERSLNERQASFEEASSNYSKASTELHLMRQQRQNHPSSYLKKKLNDKIPPAVKARDAAKPILDRAKGELDKAQADVNFKKSLILFKESELAKKQKVENSATKISFEQGKAELSRHHIDWKAAAKECESASSQFKDEISRFLDTYFPKQLIKFHPRLRDMFIQMATSWKDLSPKEISRNIRIVTDRGD